MKNASSQWSYPNSSEQIVETFLAFFSGHGHRRILGAPLATAGISTSFIIAGMQPLMPYLSGHESPPAPRLADLQRCLRTDDVELVGSNIRKISAFHMLGSWSIGDCGRGEAISLAVELLGLLGIERESLWVTTFGGDAALNLAPDEETQAEWLRVGVPETRLLALSAEDNFWSTGGPGPCGRDSEIFIDLADLGLAVGCGRPTCRPGCECDRFLEIWNLVFIEFELHQDGSISTLPLASVDTGMGVERVAMVLQRARSVFETDLLASALRYLETQAPPPQADGDVQKAQFRLQSKRMIVDHMRSALLLGVEGSVPTRNGRGSVMRRLIRRAATRGRLLGIADPFLGALVPVLAEAHHGLLTEAERQRVPEVSEVVNLEERRYSKILRVGLPLLADAVLDERGMARGDWLFQLQAERGFPADLAADVLSERGIAVDWSAFSAADLQHRAVSRVKRDH